MKTDIIVIGAGPVGLFTVFEAGILGLNCVLIDNLDKPGGQCAELYPDKPIYDIPGVPYQTGQEHVDALLKQIEPFDYKLLLNQRVDEIRNVGDSWEVKTSENNKIESKNIFIAAGAGSFEPIKPNLQSDFSNFEGQDIFYSVKDKNELKDKCVTIFGGGDSALDWAVELSKNSKINLVHRRDEFRGAEATVNKVHELVKSGKLNLYTKCQISKVNGSEKLESVEITNENKEVKSLTTDFVLGFFGLIMQLGPIANWGLNLDKKTVEVDTEKFETNQKGIYAVGDICTYPGKLKLILSGFHEGALAARACFKLARPNEKYRFEFTTSSKTIKNRLGVKSD